MTTLSRVPAKKIVRAIASAAERWSDADFPPRVRALEQIAQRTGYSVPVVEFALDRLFFPTTERDLNAVIAGELGSLDALDGFAAREGRPAAWAAPVGSVCVIASRTTIGVALIPALFALCAKCDVLVKDREDGLIAAFFATLREELDEFGTAARAREWRGAQTSAVDLGSFDAVVAFGDNRTLETIGKEVRPGAFTAFGSRAGAGYAGREALDDPVRARSVASGAARDVLLYETEGCMSLHVLFAERGGACDPASFAQLLAAEVERAEIEFPPARENAGAAAAKSQLRNLAAFRAAAGKGAVFSSGHASLVLLDPPRDEPPAFLPRTIGVIAVDSPAEALAYLREHALALEAFALSSDREDLVTLAVSAGAVRLARFGELQDPPLSGEHGGRPRIAAFIRWIDKTL